MIVDGTLRILLETASINKYTKRFIIYYLDQQKIYYLKFEYSITMLAFLQF